MLEPRPRGMESVLLAIILVISIYAGRKIAISFTLLDASPTHLTNGACKDELLRIGQARPNGGSSDASSLLHTTSLLHYYKWRNHLSKTSQCSAIVPLIPDFDVMWRQLGRMLVAQR